MGAVQVANGDAKAAMPYFTRAQQLGATQAMLGCHRGLAYDLLGQQAQRAGRLSRGAERCRRRGGPPPPRAQPRHQRRQGRRDRGAGAAFGERRCRRRPGPRLRARADRRSQCARSPRSTPPCPAAASSVAPFLQRLPSLPAGQKAAAVNLGIFPDADQPAYAYAAPSGPRPRPQPSDSVSTDRLAGIDALLASAAAPPAAHAQAPQQPSQQQAHRSRSASLIRRRRRPATVQRTASARAAENLARSSRAGRTRRLWRAVRADEIRSSELFKGIPAYVAQSADRARLRDRPLPRNFRRRDPSPTTFTPSASMPFRWSNSDSDRIVPVAGE